MRKSLVLMLAIVCAAVPAWTTKKKAEVDTKRFQEKLTKDEQVLHALDRLTFGPRPGDVEVVKKMGVKKWIDLQLHPEKIAENPALEAKLQPLETLRMTQGDTEASYPTPQMIRQVAQGRQPLPDDPVARAAVERQVRRFKLKKDEKDGDPMLPAVPLDKLLTQAQIKTLRSGKPEEKQEVLASIPAEQIDDVVIAMPPPLRNQLMPVAPEILRRKFMLSNTPQQVIAYDLSEGKLYRAILSNRQLQEQMVDFWYNHFNVFLDKGNDRFMVPSYEREAIRPHVLGHFRELLESTATAPAMLFYLDNWQSVAPDVARRGRGGKQTRGLNENYGRELLELHTLGVDGGYTQKDVTEVARCFTGWTIKNPQGGSTFNYNDRVHDKGEKIVLGVTIPAGGGKDDGEKVLDILAKHPSTARFISKELALRFVADNPPQALIDRMAKTFLDTDGDIRAVMNTMLTSKEFLSQGAYQAKVKTPFEMIVSSVRATGAEVDFAFPLADRIAKLGQPLYRKLEPTGYSNANAEWINSAALLARMNFALDLTQNKVQGTKVDQARFKEDPAHTARLMLFTNPTAPTRDAIDKAIADQKAKNPKAPPSPALVAGLVIGSPDFQRR
ncbi:MAG TPA: DUF1800 domain-containing protein [Bryobacteraceae bacterium]|jgi:uncharacterized protein (DUF1800 family)|nr:DUF1800 domain-containing protein [Bryobacteraceae bacterium]